MARKYAQDEVFRISHETYDDIDDWIRAAQETGRSIRYGMNALAMIMAYTNQAFAKELSAGPVDPKMHGRMETGHRWISHPNGMVQRQPIYTHTAWKIPVRRITERYYYGWKVRRLAPGLWMLFNDSREAYFIEFGIHPTGTLRATDKGHTFVVRVRRPIRKLSLKKTLKFVDSTRVAHRVWEVSFAPFNHNYRYKGNVGDLISMDQIQSMTGMRFI